MNDVRDCTKLNRPVKFGTYRSESDHFWASLKQHGKSVTVKGDIELSFRDLANERLIGEKRN